MYIRELAEKDCENLTALSIYVWLHTYAKEGIRDKISKFVLSNFTTDKFKEIVKSPTKKGFVVMSNQHIVGVVVVNLKSKYENSTEFGYEIETLYVHPSFQRNGVGKLLLKYLRNNVGEKSWLTTWVHNHKAIEFYKKNGYKLVGEAEFNLLDEIHANYVLSNK